MLARRNLLVLVLMAAAACTGGGAESKTVDSSDGGVAEEPRRKGPPYKAVPVTASGTITGTVTLPPAAGPAATGACAAHPAGSREVAVYLENIATGRALPANAPRRHALEAAQCTLTPGVLVATAGGTLNLSNSFRAVHRVGFTFEGMKNPMLQVPFSDQGQLVPTERVLAVPGVVNVASDQDPSVRGRIVVLEHPYGVTSADGRFTLDSVPPGTYSLVAVTATGRASATVSVQAGATTTAALVLNPG